MSAVINRRLSKIEEFINRVEKMYPDALFSIRHGVGMARKAVDEIRDDLGQSRITWMCNECSRGIPEPCYRTEKEKPVIPPCEKAISHWQIPENIATKTRKKKNRY